MNVRSDGDEATIWDIRVFASSSDGTFTLHPRRTSKALLGVALETARTTLATEFDLLLEEDDSGGPPTDESSRAYFVYRRLGSNPGEPSTTADSTQRLKNLGD